MNHFTVQEVMDFKLNQLKITPITVELSMPLKEVVQKLAESRQGVLLVKEGDQLKGAITDSVIIDALIFQKIESEKNTCSILKLEEREVVSKTDKIKDILKKFQHGKLEYLLVQGEGQGEFSPLFSEDIIDFLLGRIAQKS